MEMTHIAVLLTCHNRRELTLKCLDALLKNDLPEETAYRIFLVDDGSTDGTAEAVSARFPNVKIIRGDGHLFWNGGMRLAWDAALKEKFDYYLWLNDDTVLDPAALKGLLATHERVKCVSGCGAIVVGSTRDANSTDLSYGGVRCRSWLRRLTLDRIQPGDLPKNCDTFEGNVVLVPSQVAKLLGNLEPSFVHTLGDTDYGLRAVKAGCKNWVMPGFAGTCSRNSPQNTFLDSSLSVAERLRAMLHPKGLSVKSWYIMTRRHGGPLWFAYWLWPYIRVTLASVFRR